MRPIAAVIAVLVVAISGLAVAASSHGFPSGAPGGLELDVDLNRILLWAFAFFVVIGILGAEISREKAAKSLAERRPLWQIVLGLAVWVVVVALLSPFIREVEPPVVEDVAQEAVAPRLVPAEPDGEPAAAQVSPTRMLAVAAAAVVALLVLLHTPARRGGHT